MYLAYLIAALFILAFYALQKYAGAEKMLEAGVSDQGEKFAFKSKRKKNNAPAKINKIGLKNDISVRTFVIVGVIAFVIRSVLAYYLKG